MWPPWEGGENETTPARHGQRGPKVAERAAAPASAVVLRPDGVCLLLILPAWNLVRFWSTTAAVAMSVVAALLPPLAVVIANWGEDR